VTYVVWIAIGLAAVVFCVFAGWPLYNTYKTRGQGADVAEGQAYLKAKAKAKARAQRAQGAAGPAEKDTGVPGTGVQDTGQAAESGPAAPPSGD
jgi:hypothetical protein